MESTTSHPTTSPLRSMVRFWPVSLVLLVIGTLLGVGYTTSQPTTYTANARLAVGGDSIAAQAIPGFALASQQLASNYARFVSTEPTAKALPAGERSALVSTTASPIPSSNIILLEAKATSASVALDAANKAADSLAQQVNTAVDTSDAAKTLAAYTAISNRVAQAQVVHNQAERTVAHLVGTLTTAEQSTSPELAAAESALVKASTDLSQLTVQQNALGNKYQSEVNTTPSQTRLSVVQSAVGAGDDKRSRTERYGLLGLAAGFVLALLVASGLERLRARRRRTVQPVEADQAGRPDGDPDGDMVDLSPEHFRTPPPPSPALPRR